MKIRKDFVSNSSSCSFVISNPTGCVEAFSKLLEMPIDDIIADLASNYVSDLNELQVYVFEDDTTWDSTEMTFLEFLEAYAKKPLDWLTLCALCNPSSRIKMLGGAEQITIRGDYPVWDFRNVATKSMQTLQNMNSCMRQVQKSQKNFQS